MDGPTQPLIPSPHLPGRYPSTPQSDRSAQTSCQFSRQYSIATSEDHFLTANQTPRSALSAHSRVSLLVTHSALQVPLNSNLNLEDLNALLSSPSPYSPSSSQRTSSESSFLTSGRMSFAEDLFDADDTTFVEPRSLGNHFQSDQVFGQSAPSAHSCPRRISSSRASVSSGPPDQDAFGYRSIGPAIMLKTYLPKNSPSDSASTASKGDFDKSDLRSPFTYCTDSIYAEVTTLVDVDHPKTVDGEQMTPQFDQNSLDTQVDQSYRTAVSTTPCRTLAHTNDLLQCTEVEAVALTHPPQPIDQLDLFSEATVSSSPPSQPQPNSPVSQLISVLSDFAIPPLEPSHTPSPSVEIQTALLDLDFGDIPAQGSLMNMASAEAHMDEEGSPEAHMNEVASAEVRMNEVESAEARMDTVPSAEAHMGEKQASSFSSLTDTLNEPVGDVSSEISDAEDQKAIAVGSCEISDKDCTGSTGTSPIISQSPVAPKSDDQVPIENTVIPLSRPTSTAHPSASQPTPDVWADNATLQTDSSSRPTSAQVLDVSVPVPSVNNNAEALAPDHQLVVVPENVVVTITPATEVIKQDDPSTCADPSSYNLPAQTTQSEEPTKPSKPESVAPVATDMQCQPFPTIDGAEENAPSSPAKNRVSIRTPPPPPPATEPVSREIATSESGKDTTLMRVMESSNHATDRRPTPVNRMGRIRSISGFFKTINWKQNAKPDVPNSPGSESIKSSEEDKSSLAIKVMPKRKSLSSLKVKTRLSSLYRSPAEPVPTLPKFMGSVHASDGKRGALESVEGNPAPLKTVETSSPLTPQVQEQAQAAPETSHSISLIGVRASKISQQYRFSRSKRSPRSQSQTIAPPTIPADELEELEKPFTTVVSELGRSPLPRPKTLRKKRASYPHTAHTPILKDITLSGFLSKLMGKKTQKAGAV